MTEARDLSPATLRETEARVFLGREACEHGLVDEIGTEEDAWDHLADTLGHDPEAEPVTYHEYEVQRNPLAPVTGAAHRVAFSFGAGLGDRLTALATRDDLTIEFKR